MRKVAVVGAGLCGATAAAKLLESGYQVSVFDKGRAVCGRMSSKRTEAGYLDMGAQYFTVRSATFQNQVDSWCVAGCVAVWDCNTGLLTRHQGRSQLESSPDQERRYIGIPSMQTPVKAVLAGVPVTLNCRIHRLQRQQASWTLLSETGEQYSDFDTVLLTIPPMQAQQLLAQSGMPELFQWPASLLEPCWAVAVRTLGALHLDAIFCEHPKLRFVSHQATKSGRHHCYIFHFGADFSGENLEQPAEFWFEQTAEILRSELGMDHEIEPVAAHRWLYASQNRGLDPPGIIELTDGQLWAGGDWSYGGRVENAYLAGVNLAGSVIRHSHTNHMWPG